VTATNAGRWRRSHSGRRVAALVVLAERLALPLIVLTAAGFAAYYALDVDEWRVMSDEVLYLRLALFFGDTLSPVPEVRGVRMDTYSLLYPILIAPVMEAFDVPTAIRIAHGLNALLFASAAIPAYLLTRWVLASRAAALAVAALTVFVPWLSFSFSLLTEVVAYPAIIWAVYGIARTVAAPSARADAFALLAIGIAYAGRTQFVFLFAALPGAIVVHSLGYEILEAGRGEKWTALKRGARAAVLGHPVVWVAAAIGALVLFFGENVYGSYNAFVRQPDLWPPGMGRALIEHVNQIAVGVLVLPLPLALAFALTTLVRPAGDRRAHALAVVLVIVCPAIAVIATSFDLTLGGGLPQERYVFYVVPLLFVGMAACLVGRRPVPIVMLVVGALTAVALLQTDYVPGPSPAYASPTRFTYVALDFRAHQLGDLLGFVDLQAAPLLAGGSFLAVAALAELARRGRVRIAFAAVVGVVLVWGVALGRYCMPKVLAEHDSYAQVLLGAGRSDEARNWIDRATPEGASVGMVPSPINARAGQPLLRGELDQAVWWDPEYWNRRVDRVYVLNGGQTYTTLPKRLVTLDPRTGALRFSSGGAPSHLLVASADVRFAPRASGGVVTGGDLVLYPVRRPAGAAWATQGVAPDGRFDPTRGATLTIYPVGGTRPVAHTVTLLLERGRTDRGRFRIRGPGVRVRGEMGVWYRVSLTACVPAGRRWTGRIHVTRTAEPRLAQVRVEPKGPCGDSGQDGP
jgi:hypothetical protein